MKKIAEDKKNKKKRKEKKIPSPTKLKKSSIRTHITPILQVASHSEIEEPIPIPSNDSASNSMTADTVIWNIINAALPPGYTIPDPAFLDLCNNKLVKYDNFQPKVTYDEERSIEEKMYTISSEYVLPDHLPQ